MKEHHREKKGYALKRECGLVPHVYDKNSRRQASLNGAKL